MPNNRDKQALHGNMPNIGYKEALRYAVANDVPHNSEVLTAVPLDVTTAVPLPYRPMDLPRQQVDVFEVRWLVTDGIYGCMVKYKGRRDA